jgi:hypothetical protein
MALQADLSVQLDLTGLVGGLATELETVEAGLSAIDLPLSDADRDDALSQAQRIDVGGLVETARRIADDITPLIGQIPDVDGVVAPAVNLLEAVETLTEGGLETRFLDLFARLERALQGGEGGRLAGFIAFIEMVRAAPEVDLVRQFFDRVQDLDGGARFPDTGFDLSELGPAITGVMQALTAAARLETSLEEVERLTGIMRLQLDAEAIGALELRLTGALETDGTALADFVDGLDLADPAALAAAEQAVATVGASYRALVEALREGMAFGEATLVYLDLPGLHQTVEEVRTNLRAAALEPLERFLGNASERLAGLIPIDLPDPPAGGLAGLADEIEARLDSAAADIAAFDITELLEPMSEGLDRINRVPEALNEITQAITDALGQALEPLRGAVAALPFGTVVQALRDVADVIAEVLDRLTTIIGTVQAAIESAANTAVAGLRALETGLDTFKTQLDQVFAQATEIIAVVDLEAKLGQVQDKIDAFADVIAKADMSPYFGTARDAIEGTAGVVDKVPFELLPDEMEQDVVDAVRPIKTADADAVRQEILALLQIEEDGGFGLRDDLEAGLASIQAQLDALIATVRDDLDPSAHAGTLNAPLADAKAAIETVAPAIDLAPLREALDAAKQAIADLDPAAALAPVNAAFDDLLAGIDGLSPDQIIGRIDDRIDAARTEFLRLTRLQDMRDRLDAFAVDAKRLRQLVDVESLPREIETGLEAWRRQLRLDPRLQALDGILSVVAGFLNDAPERAQPRAFRAIADWFSEGGAAAALAGRTGTIRDATGQVREAVAAADPMALAERLAAHINGLRVAIAVHPAGPERTRLEAGLTITGDLAELRELRQAHAGYLAQQRSGHRRVQRAGRGDRTHQGGLCRLQPVGKRGEGGARRARTWCDRRRAHRPLRSRVRDSAAGPYDPNCHAADPRAGATLRCADRRGDQPLPGDP